MPSITFAAVGASARDALDKTIADIKADDLFARIVVVADHHDAARAVSHLLGAEGRGLVNVSLQIGRRLAAELAGGTLATPSRIQESAAVRTVANSAPEAQGLEPAGRRRFYRSLADAFRSMAERPPPDAVADAAAENAPAASAMNRLAESLYGKYRQLLASKGCAVPAEVAHQAAAAVNDCPDAGRLPYVIYYLPRRMSAGDIALAQALDAKGRSAVIAGLVGNDEADSPVYRLAEQLNGAALDDAVNDALIRAAAPSADPLRQRAAADCLSIVAACDPEEEVRTVIRRIAAASDTPFHRIAVIYRQSNPYDSLLRQELDFAGIPCAGAADRSLADTPTGLLLQGIAELAECANANANNGANNGSGAVDRERLMDLLAATPLRWPNPQTAPGQGRTVPAARWAKLAREAHANGTPDNWETRLKAHQEKAAAHRKERQGDDYDDDGGLSGDCQNLHRFVSDLSGDLLRLNDGAASTWATAAERLGNLLDKYRWFGDGETDDDRRRIEELITSLATLQDWGDEYDLETLSATLREGLQSPVAEKGPPVGAGVYIGTPAGIAGAEYDAVYMVGMVERQFPPRPSVNPWLADNPEERRREAGLERCDFLAAAAAGRQVTLCYPAATAERRAAYPSRWLVDAATALHQKHHGSGRLTYDNIRQGQGAEQWLTTVQSRVDGLRRRPGHFGVQPADISDYRLMGLLSDRSRLAARCDDRMRRALDARQSRNGSVITEWDGKLPSDAPRINEIGSRERPVSPSSLETWAACPYRYFLSRILGLAALPDDDDDDAISALEKGSLVHKILEEFVKQGKQTAAELLALANHEFNEAERRGVTGYYLLWEMTKAEIRTALETYVDAEAKLLGIAKQVKSKAEVSFGPTGLSGHPTEIGEVKVTVDGLEDVWFRGTIDRVDDMGKAIWVRDFKTGKPDKYRTIERRDGTISTDCSVANGQAMQLPVYLEAARQADANIAIFASYCFPLNSPSISDGKVEIYRASDGQLHTFHKTLYRIIGSARAGVFPATPDAAYRSNCHYCDFNRLCPTRRRQIWERKGRHDPSVQPFNALGGKAAIAKDDDAN